MPTDSAATWQKKKLFKEFPRILSLLLILLPVSCSARYPEKVPIDPQGIGVKDIYAHPEWTGRIVRICGRYMGWSACDANTSMVTRSDWVLKDSTGCIFVTGGSPKWLYPLNNNATGSFVCIRARIRWFGGKCTLYFIDQGHRRPR